MVNTLLTDTETPLFRSDVDAWHGHQSYAIALVKKLKPAIIVELGVQKGDSFFALCQGAVTYGGKAYGIDTWEGDDHASHYGPDIFLETARYAARNYPETARLIPLTFAEASLMFKNRSVNLLHIDGFHAYEAVKTDWETWLPKMKKNGVVLFHDIVVEQEGFGVMAFWEELKTQYQTLSFSHSNGLGVLSLDGNLSKLQIESSQL